MAKIDRETALQLMQAGETDSQIAARFGTSRQAVNLLRRSVAKEGKLTAAIAGHATASDDPSAGSNVKTQTDLRHPTLGQITDWMIQVIKDAGEARRLRNERAEAVAKVDALQAEVGKLNELLRRTNEQLATASAKSKEYEEAIKRAQIPPIPLDMPNPSTWQKSA